MVKYCKVIIKLIKIIFGKDKNFIINIISKKNFKESGILIKNSHIITKQVLSLGIVIKIPNRFEVRRVLNLIYIISLIRNSK